MSCLIEERDKLKEALEEIANFEEPDYNWHCIGIYKC